MRTRNGTRRMGFVAFTGILAAALLPLPVAAASDAVDGSTYARVRHVEGSLTLVSMEDGAVIDGSINSPIAPGDRAAADRGRAEIELADGSVVRMDEGSDLHFRSLADLGNEYETTNLLALQRGSIRIDVQDTNGAGATFQIDTEGGSVFLLSAGSFRIDSDAGMTTVSSFRGVAELSGDGGSILVRSGERSSVRSARAPIEPRRFNTLRLDEFDQFCEARAVTFVRERGDEAPYEVEQELPRPVTPYVRELSVYGAWHSVPTYGWVWRPAYSGSWGPYVDGHWTWCPSGWVWVSYEPWGWAPYRYGRWDHLAGFGWVWIPGARWSGAWVSFAVGSGYIGWSPLNYYDVPVFHDARIISVVNVNVGRLDARGWRYVPAGQFDRRGPTRRVQRGDRVPRDTELVVTRRLPQFDPKSVAARPERGADLVRRVRVERTPLPATVDRNGSPVSFRNSERRGAADRRDNAPRPTMDPRAGIRSETNRPAGRGGVAPPAAGPQVRQRPAAPGPRPPAGRTQAKPPKERGEPSRPAPGDRDKDGRGRPQEPAEDGSAARDGGGEPRPGDGDRSQARPRGKRPPHVVEKLVEGARRDSSRERAAPPRGKPGSSGKAERGSRETKGQDKDRSSSRSESKEKGKDRRR